MGIFKYWLSIYYGLRLNLLSSKNSFHYNKEKMKNNDQSDNPTIQYHKYFHVWKLWRDFMLKMGLSWFFSCLCHVKLSVHHWFEVCHRMSHIVPYCHIFMPENCLSRNEFYSKIQISLVPIECFNNVQDIFVALTKTIVIQLPPNISNSKIVYIVWQSGLMGSETQVKMVLWEMCWWGYACCTVWWYGTVQFYST